jgi:hypothetical protein
MLSFWWKYDIFSEETSSFTFKLLVLLIRNETVCGHTLVQTSIFFEVIIQSNGAIIEVLLRLIEAKSFHHFALSI